MCDAATDFVIIVAKQNTYIQMHTHSHSHIQRVSAWDENDIMKKTCVRMAMKIIIPDLDLKSSPLNFF